MKLQGPNLLPKQATRMMVVVGMNLMPLRVIGKKFVYELEVFLSYQRTLDLRDI